MQSSHGSHFSMSIRQDEVFEDCRDLVQSAADGRGSHGPKRGALHVTSSDGGEGFSYLTCSLAVSKNESPQKLAISPLVKRTNLVLWCCKCCFFLRMYGFVVFRVSLVLPFPGSVRTAGETGGGWTNGSKRSSDLTGKAQEQSWNHEKPIGIVSWPIDIHSYLLKRIKRCFRYGFFGSRYRTSGGVWMSRVMIHHLYILCIPFTT